MDNSREDEVMEHLGALGYIDPGAGSSMWQIILARFFRITEAIKSGIRKFFGARETKEEK